MKNCDNIQFDTTFIEETSTLIFDEAECECMGDDCNPFEALFSRFTQSGVKFWVDSMCGSFHFNSKQDAQTALALI